MTDLSNWKERSAPDLKQVVGCYVRIEPASASESIFSLHKALSAADNIDLWRYMPFGPFDSAEAFEAAVRHAQDSLNWKTHLFFAPEGNESLGMASYMRIRPEHGSVEIGGIVFSKKMQRSAAATEAMYLLAKHIFDDLGYRRYEWKCNNNNEASKRAALRLGFTFEGVFRHDMVVKGKTRDTAWFSIIDSEWPAVKAAFEAWIAPENFDEEGRQRRALAEIRAGL